MADVEGRVMGISKKTLRAVERIGVTQRQNLEWLIEFAESEADTPSMRDECLYFISRVTGGRLIRPSTELPLQSLRSTIRSALVDRATGIKPTEIVIDIMTAQTASYARMTVILDGNRKIYELVGENGEALFKFAVTDLLRELGGDISLCAYEACARGSLGRRRLFVRNRRARYCCRTCANNAASDAFLAKPENRERRLENRKLRFIFTCPNCKTEFPIAKMLVDVGCPNCGKHNLSGSLNTREK
jgi:hypothetical protein